MIAAGTRVTAMTGKCVKCGKEVKLGIDGSCKCCHKEICWECWVEAGHECPNCRNTSARVCLTTSPVRCDFGEV